MNSFFLALWIVDNAGACFGLFLNSFLLLAVYKTTDSKSRPYSYLFLTSALFDIFYSLMELTVQHQLLIKDGMFMVMPHGIEAQLDSWTYPWIMAPHAAFMIHSINILPALCHYRYKLITSGSTVNPLLMLRNICYATLASACLGALMGFSAYQASLRGYQHYLALVTTEWFDDDGTTPFKYVCDMRDWGTVTFFYGGSVGASIALCMAGVYTIRAWKAVSTQHSSERTRELQRQFSRSLIAQTINAGIFAIFPIALAMIAMQWRLDGKMIGTAVMSPLSWLPSANAFLTIYLIKAYRRYALRLICIKRLRITTESTGRTWKSSSGVNGNSGKHMVSKIQGDIIV
ncbi:unnamed protein product [Bursaphelenchus xylophilus]|uniref:(pine wood nematode) hypothetical protein n=1 Tax=Bursaphelenchus xylophilus TaxID=6326 RepID=A0A1I7SUW7_BURXY|nr:unnamed protein product [Bursaphelenchus xylophilus]CAG9125803.1 unnamed protein product [Bursaphelenchus xylophilus]